MVNFCAVLNCANRGDRERHLSYFRIPKVRRNDGKEKREVKGQQQLKWLANIGRTDIKIEKIANYRVCCLHFINKQPAAWNNVTNPDWAPTVNMGRNVKRKDRHTSSTKRECTKADLISAQALVALQDEVEQVALQDEVEQVNDYENFEPELQVHHELDMETQTPVKETMDTSTQTEMCAADITVLEAQAASNNKDLAKARQEADQIKFSQESFSKDDKKVEYYTGLPTFTILMVVFNYVQDKLPTRHSLTYFQQLLIILMKLRLAVTHEDLAYRFFVSESTISRVFNTGLDALYGISKLIAWPEREVLWKTMPMQFRQTLGKRVAVIIDCFEVFCDRPTSLDARTQTLLNYKHHNTIKFVLGIAPSGAISFVSAALEDSGTDNTITLSSNFFDHLLPGDVIFADRGFDMKDCAGFYGCEAEILAITSGKAELSALDVEKSREFAHLRIHVKRVIGGVRQKYRILSNTVPLEYMMTNAEIQAPKIDKIARICCALFNLNAAIVSQ
ncbi:uncharacterized protein LOC129707898 isoform X1 [Leucoraja erinacea]|uniref:uncharacterized protein LOC129707898 isoform X1 n=2 Tax=Leucoraja erinaceus TaxID=7782 RepID=UPI0024589E39|nr:uncharacterized protein LOC129707898 isoform X1 [Leucoraja erinacea]